MASMLGKPWKLCVPAAAWEVCVSLRRGDAMDGLEALFDELPGSLLGGRLGDLGDGEASSNPVASAACWADSSSRFTASTLSRRGVSFFAAGLGDAFSELDELDRPPVSPSSSPPSPSPPSSPSSSSSPSSPSSPPSASPPPKSPRATPWKPWTGSVKRWGPCAARSLFRIKMMRLMLLFEDTMNENKHSTGWQQQIETLC